MAQACNTAVDYADDGTEVLSARLEVADSNSRTRAWRCGIMEILSSCGATQRDVLQRLSPLKGLCIYFSTAHG